MIIEKNIKIIKIISAISIKVHSEKIFDWIKKIICLKHTFFDVKKCFVLMKQNFSDSNKTSLDQINIGSNQINFCL